MKTITLNKTADISSYLKFGKEKTKVSTVMIVEDDEGIRELISFALENKGFNVVAYDNPTRALENLTADNVDIIISDLMMPQMSGTEFCTIVKEHFSHIYFIMVTAKTTLEDKLQGFHVGADEYITKPFDFLELIARVQAADRIIKTQKHLIFLNEQLEKLADTDELTTLKNRRYFEHESTKELERAKRYDHTVAVVLLDLDLFKNINDTYGHATGDKALQLVSKVIVDSCRTSDIVCRYGGEEFIIFLPETNPKNAYRVAEKIRKNIEKTRFIYENNKIRLTTSIGVAIKAPHMNLNLKQLTDYADKALYMAKKKGRNKTLIYKWFSDKLH